MSGQLRHPAGDMMIRFRKVSPEQRPLIQNLPGHHRGCDRPLLWRPDTPMPCDTNLDIPVANPSTGRANVPPAEGVERDRDLRLDQ